MRKTFTLLFIALCAVGMQAQSYGILVNGKIYFAGSYTDEFEGFTQYLAHVQVKSGDYCQLYDAENKAAWAVDVNQYSESGFTRDGDRINITATGCYDFYIKLKYEADELYIGPGSNCGEGQDISGGGVTPQPGYGSSAPAKCPDVLLQGFYWDSYQDKGYGRTKWIDWLNIEVSKDLTQAEEAGQWFDLIWLPPMSQATGGTGYLPTNYSNLDSDWGTKKNLAKLIDTFHKNGARVVADIVINHCAARNGWCNFGTYDFGEYGKFTPDGSWICSTDEMNTDSGAGSCKGTRRCTRVPSPITEVMLSSAPMILARSCKSHACNCKGFHNSHINDYNKAAEAYFSVMEMWDGDVNVLQSHLNDAGWNTLTFDFAMKYQAFNNGIAADNYGGLKGAGLPGAGKARYAVTFLDSHDSFQRDGNEFCGEGNSMTVCKDKILQCYAYLLSMPGVPLVFYPHWVIFKDPIKKMINARYKTGVHSESAVSDEAGNGYYKATITGTNGEIRLLVGPNSGYGDTPAGFTLASKGTNYGVYYKTNSSRGDKNTERVDRSQTPVENVPSDAPVKGEKFIKDGNLYILCGEKMYDVMGREVGK